MNQLETVPYKVDKGWPTPFGVTSDPEGNRIQITVWVKNAKKCRLKIFQKGKRIKYIPMYSMKEHGVPDVFSVQLTGKDVVMYFECMEYLFEADKNEFVDPYAKCIAGRNEFGKKKKIHAVFYFEKFDWVGEKRKEIAFEDSILYQCHVRGFTQHQSSGVRDRGTFTGVTEKIDYLKNLGVNTLLFLPIYDFNEVITTFDEKKKLNYWGYTKDSFYFAPKASYGTGEHSPVFECKQMVKKLHQNGFQIFLDMHFEEKTPDFILTCLRYYVTEFHIDGFLVNQNIVLPELIASDPILGNVKLLGTNWDKIEMDEKKKRFGCFNDGFLVNSRCFLKGDEGQVMKFYQHFKNQGGNCATINYITQINGFTLQDLVSYDVKHNEENGEKNQDGTEYNYSWNCGQEGTTRRKKVQEMRRKQVKNAFTMLLLNLGTPMILAGDEFGNSQKGNNNAYCHDNSTTWLNWTLLEKNKSTFEFVRMLVRFRKKHKIYKTKQFMGIDYKGFGVPDISCHGMKPWISDFVNYCRELGILFYGNYFPIDDEKKSDSVYIAFNMHWESHIFFLPKINNKAKWEVFFSTSEKSEENILKDNYVLAARSITVFISNSKDE